MRNKSKTPPMRGRGPMQGGPMGGQAVEKAKDFKGTTKKLIKNYLSKYKLTLIIVFIFAIGSTIFSIVGPKILGNATTEIFRRNSFKIIWWKWNRLWENCTNIIYTISIIPNKCNILIYTGIYNDISCTKINI